MKLIVGLGNPGEAYAGSRHNIGFRVIKALSQAYRAPLKREGAVSSLVAKCRAQDKFIVLAMPMTFMNLSGLAVKALVKKYRIDLEDLLVVCDDLDLEFERMKIRHGGSSAGHRGLDSIIDFLDTDKFARLRIGIGRPHRKIEPAEYVLLAFTRKEKERIPEIIERAGSCCEFWINAGITKTMNIFNQRS